MGRERTAHTTQKPLSVVTHLLEIFTNPGDLVLDPFAGSGTTGVAAARLGRRSFSVENAPKSLEILRNRFRGEGVVLREPSSDEEARIFVEAVLRLPARPTEGSSGFLLYPS
jgi:DNA modification methylase